MWLKLAGVILRNRILILIILAIATIFMAYNSKYVRVAYELPKLLPKTDSTRIVYDAFKVRYKSEKDIIVFAIEKNPLKDLALFNDWMELGNRLKKITIIADTTSDGVDNPETIYPVDTVISIARIHKLVKHTAEKRFSLDLVINHKLQSETELKKVAQEINNLPIYEGLIYNKKTGVSLMALSMNRRIFASKLRANVLEKIQLEVDEVAAKHQLNIHYSGLPFIRTVITNMVKRELKTFVLLSLLVTIIILFLFFKSGKPVAVSMLVVMLGVIWSVGTLGLFHFEISILTSLIPPLIIVIGVPNCIFLVNKYHQEYRLHGNNVKALSRVIQKVGNATFLTNLTTAAGFATFIFTDSAVLQEFGIVASISIMAISVLSLLIIPILFSYLNPPKEKQTKHLDNQWVNFLVAIFLNIVTSHRRKVYLVMAVMLLVSAYGISLMKTTGNIVDDLPKDHKITKDLAFFENSFNGVMPFEINIDAKKPGFASKDYTLKKIEKLEKMMAHYPVFSKPLSIVEGIKFIKQGYYNGNPKKYSLINRQEKVFFKPYFENTSTSQNGLQSFVDSTKQNTRISFQMADVGTMEMQRLLDELKPRIDSIFNPSKYKIDLTGTSVVFLAGADYLVKNLFVSLFLAIGIIALIMALVFSSFRMILISIITNLIPLIFTAAVMGYAGIAIKPSTILVFSIAFGISVDDTIHYLVKYRQELRASNFNIRKSVILALKETGVSMIYTSIILFFGFSVFDSSQFGGTFALGVLISLTLFIAMLSNLILLPSFLLSLEKAITTSAFDDSYLELYDDDEDIDLDALEIEKPKNKSL